MNKAKIIEKIDKVISDYKEAHLKSKYMDLSDLHNNALVESLEVRSLNIIESATDEKSPFRKKAYYAVGRNVSIDRLIGILEALKGEMAGGEFIEESFVEEEHKYKLLEEEFKYEKKILKDERIYKCFVIMPIGKKGTVEYENNTAVFDKIIKPCVKNSGYAIECYHADLITESGDISKQVIEALRDDPIVIADLRRNNPNVIYELGIRHAFGKRSILVCSAQSEHIFHTTNYRAVEYKIDGTSNQEFYSRLSSSISNIIENPTRSDNPVTDSIGIADSSDTKKPLQALSDAWINDARKRSNEDENINDK